MKRKLFFDIFLVVLLLFLSFFLIFFVNGKKENGECVKINVGGNISFISLEDDGVYVINNGTHTLEVKEKKIRIISADCKDKICVNMGWINKNGESIVCLPYSLSLEITSRDEEDFVI